MLSLLKAFLQVDSNRAPGWLIAASLVLLIVLGVGALTREGRLGQGGVQEPGTIAGDDQSSICPRKSLTGWQCRLPVLFGRREVLPKSVLDVVSRGNYLVEPKASQRLAVPGSEMWAVPGDAAVCLFSLQPPGAVGVTCATKREVLAQGLSMTLLRTPASRDFSRRLVVGIAPREVRTVTAYSPGAAVTIPVEEGLFVRRDGEVKPPDHFVFRP